jgi:hypothetical protein
VEPADLIAVYAALVGTAAAAWPIWQARKARRPDVEVALFTVLLHSEATDQQYRVMFLEARNRGDHPVRVLTAGISNEKINYSFMPGRIEVAKPGAAFSHASVADNFSEDIARSAPTPPPIPGIVLPRDAGARMLPEEAMRALLASLMKLRDEGKAYQGYSDEALFEEVGLDLDAELTGWVSLSTGEYFSTKTKMRQH